MKRMHSQIIVLLLVLVLLVSACSSGNNASNSDNTVGDTPAQSTTDTSSNSSGDEAETAVEEPVDLLRSPESKEPVTLRIVGPGPTTKEERLANAVIEREKDPNYLSFEEKYPWITLEFHQADYNDTAFMEKAAALQAAGTPADLTWSLDLTAWAVEDLLADITPFIDQDPLMQHARANATPGIFEGLMVNGKVLGLLRDLSTHVVYVNKDHLSKYGLDLPSNDWTWEEFREIAKAVTDPSVNEFGLGPLDGNMQYPAIIKPLSDGHVEKPFWLNADMTAMDITNPGVADAFEWTKNLVTVDGSAINNAKKEELGWGTHVDTFLSGQIAFYIYESWITGWVGGSATFDWDILPMPRGEADQVTMQKIVTWSILESSPNKEAAYLYISDVYHHETQLKIAQNGGLPYYQDPAFDAALDNVELFADKNASEAIKLTSKLCCVHPGSNLPGWGDFYQNIFWGPLNYVLFNDGSFSENLVPAVEEWNVRAAEIRAKLN